MNTKPIILEVPAFEDFRGYLAVLYDKSVDFKICQINQGYSRKVFTLRGLHGYNARNDDELAQTVADKINGMIHEDDSVFK